MHKKRNETHIVVKVSLAQTLYSTFTQEQVDCIFREAALAAADARTPLAHVAAEESGMVVIEAKVVKIKFVSKGTYCGLIDDGEEHGIFVTTKPISLSCKAFPTTRTHTTTIQFISFKTYDGVIFSSHPRNKTFTCHAKFILDASIKVGAPYGVIGPVEEPTLAILNTPMHHPSINLISATGGTIMVKSTFSSSKSRRILKTFLHSIVDLM
jgi:acetaldehyde dehydrogenase/alcohol dehydrogenase